MPEVKITKKQVLDKWDNTTCSGSYHLIYGRAYNTEKTGYYKFKFVLFFDYACDLWDPETKTDIPLNEAINSAIDSFIFGLNADNENSVKDFFARCNDTINRYNIRNRARNY